MGVGAVLLAAAVFATVPIVSQFAFRAGVTLPGLISCRSIVAAGVLWLLVAALRRPLPTRREARWALALGVLYGAHTALMAGAYARLDAGLADLLFFTNPMLIMVGSVALGREKSSPRRVMALAVTLAGLGCTLLTGTGGAIDLLPVVLALAAAVIYAGYVLGSVTRIGSSDPLVLTTLTMTGAAGTLGPAGIVPLLDSGFGGGADGAALVVAVALAGSVLGPGLLIIGMARLGASRASIVVGLEPVLAGLLGAAVFGDPIGAAGLLGAGLVLTALPILELRLPRARRRRDEPASHQRPDLRHPARRPVVAQLTHDPGGVTADLPIVSCGSERGRWQGLGKGAAAR